jgi:hypothetical protein
MHVHFVGVPCLPQAVPLFLGMEMLFFILPVNVSNIGLRVDHLLSHLSLKFKNYEYMYRGPSFGKSEPVE